MKLIEPIAVTSDILVSSSVPEADYPEWAAGTSYAVGDKVIRLTTHSAYEALTPGAGKVPEASPSDWLPLGATNRWKLFDNKVGTASELAAPLVYALSPGRVVTAVAFMELSAVTVRVTVSDAVEGVVYDKPVSLTAPISASTWHAYFFEPYRRRTAVEFTDLPSYRRATITVRVEGRDGEVSRCGVCLLGIQHDFAEAADYGAVVGIQDYSRKVADDWGNLELSERSFSKRASWQVTVEARDVDRLHSVLAGLRATAALYIGSGRFAATKVYGFWKDFDVTIQYCHQVECSIELEGLI